MAPRRVADPERGRWTDTMRSQVALVASSPLKNAFP